MLASKALTLASASSTAALSWSSCCLADGVGHPGVDRPVPGVVGPGQLELGLVEVDLALGLVELGLVGPRVDLEQQVARLDLRPFLERHLDQVAGDPGADVHRLDRVGPAGEVHVIGDFASDGPADRDDGRLRGSDGNRIAMATVDRRHQRAGDPEDERTAVHGNLTKRRCLGCFQVDHYTSPSPVPSGALSKILPQGSSHPCRVGVVVGPQIPRTAHLVPAGVAVHQ